MDPFTAPTKEETKMRKLLLAAAALLALAGSAQAQNVDFSKELSAHARTHPIGEKVQLGEPIGWIKSSDIGCTTLENELICNPIDHYTDVYQRGGMCATYGVPFYSRPYGKPVGLIWGEMQIVTDEKSDDGKYTRIWTKPGQHIKDGGVWPYSLKALRSCG
jgi:hypothetical protein